MDGDHREQDALLQLQPRDRSVLPELHLRFVESDEVLRHLTVSGHESRQVVTCHGGRERQQVCEI